MSVLDDLKILYHLVLKPVRGRTHAERLESFYGGQAEAYDSFRERLLQGRQPMLRALQMPDDGVWVDLGGGTGSNLEILAEQVGRLRRVYVVDLARSLLEIAKRRCRQHGWDHVQTCEADATTFAIDEPVDVVTFSYSLTMIPDWFAAIERAYGLLKSNGQIGVVDFYVSRKYPPANQVRHGWMTRHFWPIWFSHDNVFPSRDHLPFLQRRFETVCLEELRARVPYLPGVRTPYYIFIGRKSAESVARHSVS